MQGKWIATSVLLLWVVAEVVTAAAKQEKKGVGCLGKLPDEVYTACSKCNVKLPEPFERPATLKKGKREAVKKERTTTSPRPPVKADISTAERNNIKCVLKELKLIDDTGVGYTLVRRFLDKHNAGSPDQSIFWRQIKTTAQDSSNYKRAKDVAIEMFIDGIIEKYKAFCGV